MVRQYRDMTFQLTPARGERPVWSAYGRTSRCFNSRPRAASDSWASTHNALALVSTHARARRATRRICRACIDRLVSTHARARRATGGSSSLPATTQFQLTPARGERLSTGKPSGGRIGFNSRPRAASDRSAIGLSALPGCFNSRPRAASDSLFICVESPREVSTHARARRATTRH